MTDAKRDKRPGFASPVQFCSVAVLAPTVGHTVDVLSPFIPIPAAPPPLDRKSVISETFFPAPVRRLVGSRTNDPACMAVGRSVVAVVKSRRNRRRRASTHRQTARPPTETQSTLPRPPGHPGVPTSSCIKRSGFDSVACYRARKIVSWPCTTRRRARNSERRACGESLRVQRQL